MVIFFKDFIKKLKWENLGKIGKNGKNGKIFNFWEKWENGKKLITGYLKIEKFHILKIYVLP